MTCASGSLMAGIYANESMIVQLDVSTGGQRFTGVLNREESILLHL